MADDKKSPQDTPKGDEGKKPTTALTDQKTDDQKTDDGKKPDAKDDTKSDAKDDGKKQDPPADSKDEGNKDGKQSDDGKPKVPDKYELQRPEDELFTDEDMARYADVAKTMGLTQAQAQQLVDADAAYAEVIRETLLEDLKADKDLGGKKFEATVATAQKGLNEFLRESPADERDAVLGMLTRSGFGNHKALVRAFARLGRMVSEDQPGGGKAGGQGEKTMAQALYGQD